MKNYKIIIAVFMFVNVIQAQTENVFWERSFWETNPTVEIVEQKIAEGNDATRLNPNGFDAVVYAILQDAENNVIQHLLTKKENEVNKLTHDKRTYLFWAAYKNNPELMAYLIQKNARMDLKDSHHFSVSTFAAANGVVNTAVYDLCINNGIDIKTDVNENGANALLLAIPHLKNFELVTYFTSKGLDITSEDTDGNGVFNYTASAGNKAMLALLIEKGLSNKSLNKKGENALFLATKGSRSGYNSLEYLKYLEAFGMPANITNNQGKTPLHNLAYGNKDVETISYFLSKGVNANQIDDAGNTALINASAKNTLQIITLLASKTENINHITNNGQSALTNAVGNTLQVVNFLIEKGADVHIIDSKGNNLGYYLIKTYSNKEDENFHNKLNALTRKGFDIKDVQKDGNTLYHLALDNKDALQLLKKISSYGVDVNAKNKSGLTPLHKAVMQAKDATIIKYLLSIGADKNIKTDFDETVFDLAEENESLQNNKIDINFLK